MRHGQAVSNVKDIISCWPEKFKNPLTKAGRAMAEATAKKLLDKNIDLIFCSPLLRTRQTAEIVGKKLKIKPKIEKRFREQNVGALNGISIEELSKFFGERSSNRFSLRPKKGEIYSEIIKRMIGALKDIDKNYKGKNILIVSHELPIMLLEARVRGITKEEFYQKRIRVNLAEAAKLN